MGKLHGNMTPKPALVCHPSQLIWTVERGLASVTEWLEEEVYMPYHRLRHLLFNTHPAVVFVLEPKIVLVRHPNNNMKAFWMSVWVIDEVRSGGMSQLI